MSRITLSHLTKMKKNSEKITILTAYDAIFSRLLSDAGLDVILVGDSLGTTIAGHTTTVPVTLQDMIYHTGNVCRAMPKSLVIADMPYMSYPTIDKALEHAACLMRAGGEMVKLEGNAWVAPIIEQLTEKGIPVCAHIGLTTQSIHLLGGKVQGRNEESAKKLLETALLHQASGAQMLVLECIPWQLAQEITQAIKIPTIGIGAGPHCDGQVLVTYDMLGLTPGKPFTFVKNFMLDQTNGIGGAIQEYVIAVKAGTFPTMEHSFS